MTANDKVIPMSQTQLLAEKAAQISFDEQQRKFYQMRHAGLPRMRDFLTAAPATVSWRDGLDFAVTLSLFCVLVWCGIFWFIYPNISASDWVITLLPICVFSWLGVHCYRRNLKQKRDQNQQEAHRAAMVPPPGVVFHPPAK